MIKKWVLFLQGEQMANRNMGMMQAPTIQPGAA